MPTQLGAPKRTEKPDQASRNMQFRAFIEDISGEGLKKKAVVINRSFYENLISRIILFRSLEKIYGDGKKKIGNLRAAVIPYSVSILYNYSDGGTDGIIFDLNRIWIKEGLEQDLADYFFNLMELMNSLIKKYSTSDDPSENSKTQELWERISGSDEIETFMTGQNTTKILNSYSVTKEEYKKRLLKIAKTAEVNFKLIQDNVSIHAKGMEFYKKLLSQFHNFSINDKERLESIIVSVYKHKDIDQEYIDYEREIINKIMVGSPEIFDDISLHSKDILYDTIDFIIDLYNSSINNQEDVKGAFSKAEQKAKTKNIKDHNVWGKIGELLVKGDAPQIADVIAASSWFSDKKVDLNVKEKQKINEMLMIQMVDWSSKMKVLSPNEIKYI